MKRYFGFFSLLFYIGCLSHCGYTTKSALPPNLKTIYIEPFKNKIDYINVTQANRELYIPLLERDVRNAIIDRFLFDGSLKVAKEETADLVLKGELVSYNRGPLRYDDNEDVEEYRVQISVDLVLLRAGEEEPYWTESGFTGETTYFITGPLATTEQSAIQEALTDLAKRVVERTIENW